MTAVRIRDWPTPVEFRRGTLLDAALKGGVPVPYQCRSGECGSCKCRLLKGRVDHDSCLPEALSERERSDGWVLACRARPKTDVEVEYGGSLTAALPQPQHRKGRVEQCEKVAADTIRLLVTVKGGPLSFIAGQYVRLRFGLLPARSYSMANLPGGNTVEFFIREMPGGLVSGHIAEHVAEGDPVMIDGPHGHAYLRTEEPSLLIAAAGGSGLAPMLSIAREAAERGLNCPLHLYFGVRREADLFAADAFAELLTRQPGLNIHVVLSEPEIGRPTRFRSGFPHEALAADFDDLAGAHIYSAGPPPMVAAVTRTALRLGAETDNIRSDPFTPDQPIEEAPREGVVTRGLRLLGLSKQA